MVVVVPSLAGAVVEEPCAGSAFGFGSVVFVAPLTVPVGADFGSTLVVELAGADFGSKFVVGLV